MTKFFSAVFIAFATGIAAAHDHDDMVDAHDMGTRNFGKFMLDKFEAGDDLQRWDAQAWYGGDRDKLWMKSEGERNDGETESAEVQALYSRAISPFFDLQFGARHDFQPQPTRDWLAVGVQGLAPYFFETEATLFIGESGHSALRLKASYDALITQRLILQPELEANLHGNDDRDTGTGSGLGTIEFGLRLRYEIFRELAPYVGYVWTREYGNTADFSRADGGATSTAQWVAGIKLWF